MMKLIVGLGNPGKKYDLTRHNVGFRTIDVLAQRWQMEMNQEKFHAWFATGSIRSEKVVLLKPTTFMNRSGQAVLAAGRFYRLELSDLLTISDDLALDVGKLRLRGGGSAGGHNGLQDIVDRIGDNGFARLRIGIGQALGDAASYVLSRFGPDEEETIETAVAQAANAVEYWLENGTSATMNKYNG